MNAYTALFLSDVLNEHLVFFSQCHPEIDHCADGTHGCEQEFMNTDDSCVCKCRKGYTLRPDGKTCKSKCQILFCTVLADISKRKFYDGKTKTS